MSDFKTWVEIAEENLRDAIEAELQAEAEEDERERERIELLDRTYGHETDHGYGEDSP